QAPRKKGPPMWVILGPIALVGIALAGAGVMFGRSRVPASPSRDPAPIPSANFVVVTPPLPPPSAVPSAVPSAEPSAAPSAVPSADPSAAPSAVPSAPPSARPKPHNDRPPQPPPGGCVPQPGKPCLQN